MSTPSATDNLTSAVQPSITGPAPVPPVGEVPASDVSAARILVVDDEPTNVKIAQKYLRELGYQRCRGLTDPFDAWQEILVSPPDLVLLDVMMPGLTGTDLLERIRSTPQTCPVPVVILTASNDSQTRIRVLEAGATDFLAKPVDPSELAARVRNCLTLKAYHDRLAAYSANLEDAIRRRTAELEASRQDLIHCLARAAEYRDDTTGYHILRVGKYAGLIGRALGMSADQAATLEQAAQLHDVGKIGVPDSILLKPGRLDPEEYQLMQRHVAYGRRILDRVHEDETTAVRDHVSIGAKILEQATSPVLVIAARIALTHHERWDGTGYPLGLAGEDIPLEGRIAAVADVFDALSSRRPYKPPFPVDRCFEMLAEGRGTHFDPRVLDAFLGCRAEVIKVQMAYADL